MAKTRSERTSKKRRYRAPSGETRIHYHKDKHSKILFGMCKKELMGVPKTKKFKPKTKKVPNRPYAGNYCSKCSRIIMKEKLLEKMNKEEEKK